MISLTIFKFWTVFDFDFSFDSIRYDFVVEIEIWRFSNIKMDFGPSEPTWVSAQNLKLIHRDKLFERFFHFKIFLKNNMKRNYERYFNLLSIFDLKLENLIKYNKNQDFYYDIEIEKSERVLIWQVF